MVNLSQSQRAAAVLSTGKGYPQIWRVFGQLISDQPFEHRFDRFYGRDARVVGTSLSAGQPICFNQMLYGGNREDVHPVGRRGPYIRPTATPCLHPCRYARTRWRDSLRLNRPAIRPCIGNGVPGGIHGGNGTPQIREAIASVCFLLKPQRAQCARGSYLAAVSHPVVR